MASEDERERLFHLFHDLVGEALEQYDAGYAVDLENRYYELADQLIADRTELEQQLAQAQEEYATLLDLFIRTRDELWIHTGPTPLTDEGKAFLAEHFAKQDHL